MSLKDRLQRLLPNGYPRYVRVYDNGGETADRYTVVFTGRYNNRVDRKDREYMHIGMSEDPFAPNGVCLLEGTPRIIDVDEKHHRWAPEYGQSNHLGKRIHWHELPEACIKAALHAYKELWDLYGAETHIKGKALVPTGATGGIQIVRSKKARSRRPRV